jgi:hypothetical protein
VGVEHGNERLQSIDLPDIIGVEEDYELRARVRKFKSSAMLAS